MFCQGHHFVIAGKDVQAFFFDFLRTAESFKKHVDELPSREAGIIDTVVNIIKTEEYDSNQGLKQPERAYLLNLKTQVAHLATKLNKQSQ